MHFEHPLVEVELLENVPVGRKVADMQATIFPYPSLSIGHFIQSGDDDSVFRIDFLTGRLSFPCSYRICIDSNAFEEKLKHKKCSIGKKLQNIDW